ncbi:MAG: hypothetical protein QM756_34950 [Polyangiaceae bacterium]
MKASLTNEKALWAELCQRFEKRTVLPYKDASEPHLRYLEYKAELAKVANRLSTTLYGRWNALSQKLEKKPSSADKAKLIVAYKADFEAARKVAVSEYDALNPLLEAIGADSKDHASQLPKSSRLAPAPANLPPPWWEQGRAYVAELERATKTGDVSGLHPSAFFPEDDFIAAID